MISDRTIQAIRDLSIHEVVGKYVKLKKDTGCCPFHNESTPSFHVNEKKGIFKCFGCGVAGDGIRFVEMHEKLTFTETLERLARDHSIAIEYEDSLTPELRKEKQDKMDVYRQILNYAQAFYRKQLNMSADVKAELLKRGIDDDQIEDRQYGYAPDNFQGITPGIIERGWYEPALHLGLIGNTNGKSWDAYRNRITIPLTDRHGQIIGFAGRILGAGEPKYINPKESDMYIKTNVWYGLDRAAKAISKENNVYVVEGYFDVDSMQRRGVLNTIASCGTSIDDKQWRILKPYTHCISMMYDGDKPGQDKLFKHTIAALKQGFHVQHCEMMEGIDPDDMARKFDEAIN